MLDGTNYNSPCSFAEEIVEYIYDEMNGETKARFETHIAKCSSCADELAGFGIVRSKVSDWKLKEFSPLATPIIELPIVQTIENTQVKRRWFESLRDLVMLSPAWMTQTAAFATLAICFGIAFYAFNSQAVIDEVSPPQYIAEATPNVFPTPPIKLQPTPKVEVTEPNPSKPTVTVVKTTTQPTPKKVVVQAVQTEIKPVVIAPKNKPNRGAKIAVKPKKSDVNLLSNEDDEDDSLRLSDLFEEISMK
jgi:Putative zinc-finger